MSVTKDSVLRFTVETYKKHGCNQVRTAQAMGISRSALQGRLWKAASEGIQVPTAEKELNAEDPSVLFERDRQRYQDQIKSLSSRLQKAHRDLNDLEDFRASIFNIVSRPVTTPKWSLMRGSKDEDVEMPLLFVSDWQIGEVIRKSSIGFNEFSIDIARERVRAMVSKTIELSFKHRGKKKYPGIYYLRGGDMVSGEIHDDLRETNDLQSCEAARELVEIETWAIDTLGEAFGPVHVKSVPGNHGRTTDKPRSKWRAESNFDVMTHYWLESIFKAKSKHVTFDAPSTGDALFDVYGFNFCMTHGDRIGSRGGEGYLGAVATITRGMRKTFDYYATLGRALDYILVGHFHVAMSLEYGYSNGSLPGYSEYAKGFRMRPQAPQQWLLYVHPSMGVIDEKRLILGPRPKLERLQEAA